MMHDVQTDIYKGSSGATNELTMDIEAQKVHIPTPLAPPSPLTGGTTIEDDERSLLALNINLKRTSSRKEDAPGMARIPTEFRTLSIHVYDQKADRISSYERFLGKHRSKVIGYFSYSLVQWLMDINLLSSHRSLGLASDCYR